MSNWFRTYGFADILDNLLIGAYPLDADDVAMLKWMGVKYVLNLVEDSEYRPRERQRVQAALAEAGIEEQRLSLTDYGNLPLEALEEAVMKVTELLRSGTRTYVHCRAGWQRSAAVAAGVVALRDGLSADAALAYVQARKPSAEPLPHQREDLRHWLETRDGGSDAASSPAGS